MIIAASFVRRKLNYISPPVMAWRDLEFSIARIAFAAIPTMLLATVCCSDCIVAQTISNETAQSRAAFSDTSTTATYIVAPKSAAPSFRPRPVDGQRHLPPSPPAAILKKLVSQPTSNPNLAQTFTSAPAAPQLSASSTDNLNRPGPDDSDDGQPMLQPKVVADQSTFASQTLPQSGRKTDDINSSSNGFEAPSVSSSSDRFGSFGANTGLPTSGRDRFAPRGAATQNSLGQPPKQPAALLRNPLGTTQTEQVEPLRQSSPTNVNPPATTRPAFSPSRQSMPNEPKERFAGLPTTRNRSSQPGSLSIRQDSFSTSNDIQSPAAGRSISSANTPSSNRFTNPTSTRPVAGSPATSGNDLRDRRIGSVRHDSNSVSSSRSSSPQPLRSTAPTVGRARSVIDNSSATPPVASRASSLPPQSSSDTAVDGNAIEFARRQISNIQTSASTTVGTPVKLIEMFFEPLTSDQRKQMVAQYWETYFDLASLKVAADYQQWLDALSPNTEVDRTLLSAAKQMADDRRLAAEIQLGKSQSRLLDFMPNPRDPNFLPVPADTPLIDQYVTDIEKYARIRPIPRSLRGIDTMLERTLTLITHRAATAESARSAADQARQAIPSRQSSIAAAITAGKLWRDARVEMIASAVNYNQAISDFVLTLEPGRPPQQLVTYMLGASQAQLPSRQANRNLGVRPVPQVQFR